MNKCLAAIFGLLIFSYSNYSLADFTLARPYQEVWGCSSSPHATFKSLGQAYDKGRSCIDAQVEASNSVYYAMSVAGETYSLSGLTHNWVVNVCNGQVFLERS